MRSATLFESTSKLLIQSPHNCDMRLAGTQYLVGNLENFAEIPGEQLDDLEPHTLQCCKLAVQRVERRMDHSSAHRPQALNFEGQRRLRGNTVGDWSCVKSYYWTSYPIWRVPDGLFQQSFCKDGDAISVD